MNSKKFIVMIHAYRLFQSGMKINAIARKLDTDWNSAKKWITYCQEFEKALGEKE